LARERKEALDRERERADALARELAGLRDAIGAMRARATPAPPPVPAAPQPSEPVTARAEPTSRPVEPILPLAEPIPLRAEPILPRAEPTPPLEPAPARLQETVSLPPPPPAAEPVRLDPPLPVSPPASVSRLPDAPVVAPPTSVPQAIVQAPAVPSTAPNEQRLIERAETLLKMSDISGARLILERAMSAGSARAAYLLAQTYDPRVLDEWRVVGLKGDPAKAQELYARAQAGGIREAGQRRP
jgi:hypothetical protein